MLIGRYGTWLIIHRSGNGWLMATRVTKGIVIHGNECIMEPTTVGSLW